MLTRKKNALLKIALLFLPVVLVITAITIPSFAAQSAPAPKAGSFSGEKAVGEEKVVLLPVQVDGKDGFIDKTGKIIINPQFDYADFFEEGLARVRIGGKYGFIDKTGKIVSNPQFDDAGVFREGLARVRIGGKWGYIDKTGKIVIEPQFYYAGFFHEGLAEVEIGGKRGYID